MRTLLIGIDMGTGSSKAVLTTTDGEILATATRPRPHSMIMPRPSWAEVDAEAVWWGDVVALSRELMRSVGSDSLAAVCVSGAGPCLVLCDEDDRPVRPAILYGIDMRATAQIAELTETFGNAEIVERCGKALSTQAVGPKLRWVDQHEPDAWQRSRRWFNSSSYVVRLLTGAYVLDHHTASQCDPLYDIASRDWHAPWVQQIVGHLEMPTLAWSSDVIGRP